MKVVTKLAIALLLYNAVCVRLIDWERERISKIYPTGLFCLWYIFFEKLLLMCCQRKYILNHSTVYQFILHFSWLCHGCFKTEMGQGENHLSPTVPKKCTDGVIICLL